MNPIVILHGALGSHHQFDALVDRFDHETTVIDFMGHGSAPDTNEPWSILLFSKQLESDLEARGISNAHIFGYSMGGYVAIDCALRRPDLISRIVTLGTKLSWSVEQAMKEIKMLNPDVIEEKVPKFAADLARRHGDGRWKEVLKHTAHLMTELGADPVLTHDRVAECKAQVRYLIGDRDEMVSLEETIGFYRATPEATLGVLPNTRHPIEKVDLSVLIPHLIAHLTQA